MLTSPPENIAAICQVIAEVNPKRLLDVGCAWGKFGLLARETLAAQDAERGDWTPDHKSRYFVGIEGAEYFQNKALLAVSSTTSDFIGDGTSRFPNDRVLDRRFDLTLDD
jgi:hypothetical protein